MRKQQDIRVVQGWDAKWDPYKAALINDLRLITTRLLFSLPPREEFVLRLYFGFLGPPHTLRAIGDELGIGVEAVRRTLSSALRRLRHPRYSVFLRAFVDEECLSECPFGDKEERFSGEVIGPAARERLKLLGKWGARLRDLEQTESDTLQQMEDFDTARNSLILRRESLGKEALQHPVGSFLRNEVEKDIKRYTSRIDSLHGQVKRANENLANRVRPEIEKLSAAIHHLDGLDAEALDRWFKPIQAERKRVAAETKKAGERLNEENKRYRDSWVAFHRGRTLDVG